MDSVPFTSCVRQSTITRILFVGQRQNEQDTPGLFACRSLPVCSFSWRILWRHRVRAFIDIDFSCIVYS